MLHVTCHLERELGESPRRRDGCVLKAAVKTEHSIRGHIAGLRVPSLAFFGFELRRNQNGGSSGHKSRILSRENWRRSFRIL